MIIGGIILFVIGAILAFGVSFAIPGVALPVIGGILMVAGAVLFIVGLIFTIRGRSTTTSTTIDPQSGSSVQRTRQDGDPRV